MPTNDGYTPYPIGLTAEETVAALQRSNDLDNEFSNYVKFFTSSTSPNISQTKNSDIWLNSDTSKLYRASIDGSTLIWFEV
jgi:hypothetical protein